jgi:hypothetical protein
MIDIGQKIDMKPVLEEIARAGQATTPLKFVDELHARGLSTYHFIAYMRSPANDPAETEFRKKFYVFSEELQSK